VNKAGSRASSYLIGGAAILVTAVVFVVPFVFILFMAFKDRRQSSLLDFSLPTSNNLISNIVEVVQARDFMLLTAFLNSTILTVASVTGMVILGAMVAFVRQRRMSRWNRVIDLLVLSGLIIPPAVVPTIWVLQEMGLFRTLSGLILVEIAFGLAFTVLLFQAFISTIPKELDEAAILDGAGPFRLFFRVIFPLLKSVIVTVIVVQSVFVFNDFVNPLYFLPGDENATVQLTLFNFQSQFTTQYNLLFTDILLITVPMLLMFLFFNKRIVEGMTAGAVKG
jgi:raffinose/stachyose/melibiose transport system permease protein